MFTFPTGFLIQSLINILANFDWTQPKTASDFSSQYATDEWLLQETSGAYANNVGTETLTNSGGLQGQNCPGIWDGSAYNDRKAWEAIAATDQIVSSGSTAGDVANQDFCVRLVFRTSKTLAGEVPLVTKYASGPGWGLYKPSTANINFFTHDGSISELSSAYTNLFDGAPHYVTALYIESTNTMYMKSDDFAESSTVGRAGSFANAVPIKLGRGWVNTSAGVQYLHAGVCVGADAQAMYDEDFFHVGKQLDSNTPLTTALRGSAISLQTGPGQVAHFAPNTLAIGYSENFSHASKLGAYFNSAVVNLVPYSEALSLWGLGLNLSTVDNAGDAPDGFRSASSITTSAANGFAGTASITVSPSTVYTLSFWVTRNGASDVVGALRFWDQTNLVYIDSTPFTATATAQLVSVTVTTGATTAAMQAVVRVDVSGESLFPWGVQLNLGTGRGAYIRTSGAAATLSASDTQVAAAVAAARGEVSFTGICELLVDVDQKSFWQVLGSADQKQCILPSNTKRLSYLIRNGVAVVEALTNPVQLFSAGDEVISRWLWDEAASGVEGYKAVSVSNSVRDNGAVSPWTAPSSGALGNLAIGQQGGTAIRQLDGFIANLTSHDAPGAL